jgi:hypothetical protein
MDMSQTVDIVHDAESSGLLNDETVDYTASPWKLKDNFKMHIVSVLELETNQLIAFYNGPTLILDGRKHEITIEGFRYVLEDYEPVEYKHYQLNKFPDYIKKRKIRKAIAHNGINFDLLAYKAYFGLEYSINEDGVDTWGGNVVDHHDTLVVSKTLNPDRYGGHSLDNLSKIAGGTKKVEFRKHVPEEDRFKHFAADMLYYNLFDLKSNLSVYEYLNKEAGDYNWQPAITLEKCVADLVTRQSHRGFAFNKKLAEAAIEELDRLMEERRQRVEPLLPPKKATKAIQKDFTPPKLQFKKDGTISGNMEKFIAKIEAERIGERQIKFRDKIYDLPLPEGVPLVTQVPANIDDSTHIKDWLVSLGWNPTEWKEKDLTVDAKKQKLTYEKFRESVQRYVDQTLESNFKDDRCEFLNCKPKALMETLMKKGVDRPVRVRTNPSFTKGQDKEMCNDLDRMSEKFPFAKDCVEYLTFKHRRNSILGGGLEWEDGEEAEKGYLAAVREDGRIPTPADTCGAATSRMKHRLVANIPRITSLYGDKMRALFEVDENDCYQIGYDFASLEARIESHYCFRYEKPTEEGARLYCESLLLEKPHDVHTMMAKRISEIINQKFERSPAKNVKYGCTYGAQAAKVAKTIGASLEVGEKVFNAFWDAAMPLKLLKEALQKHWEGNGKKYIVTIDGRKVPTRAAHAILNSLFQSAGVICAKRSMVRWETKMKAEGLSVDFWTEDWKNKQWGQQMIAYHDESQIEVTKGLVKFKKFPTKEECNEFRDKEKANGKIWSEAHESPKGGWFVAYSRVGELVVEAVNETTEFYKLKVPLSADYVVGKSWADCH